MSTENFSDIGRVEALNRLYQGTPFKGQTTFTSEVAEVVSSHCKTFLEGVDFDLTYFPLKHLGYKCVTAVSGEIYADFAHPRLLSVRLGLSSKLDFEQTQEIWSGIVLGAKEYGYADVSLDLGPSQNGLVVSICATGSKTLLAARRRPAPKSKDLICVSGSLGAAFLGMQLLEKGRKEFEKSGQQPDLEKNRMLVAAYLKPELGASVISQMEDSDIYPSAGYLITRGLADAVKRLACDTGLGAKVYADKIPFEGNSFDVGKELDIDPISAAMNGGEDYKLLFTVPILKLDTFRHDFQTFDIIGHLALPEAGTTLVTLDGAELPLRAPGWMEGDE